MGRHIPKYAILSHTWEDEEVLFEHMGDSARKARKGWRKIQMTLQLAQRAGLEYVWVDTCCIDKRSSAELSEAINSMYRWYGRSEICYAFLSDHSVDKPLGASCRWFTRGWTLQELIAPSNVVFFDQAWNMIGNKIQLSNKLSKITGINPSILRHEQSLASIAVAQKMSWAALRQTTRPEDEAYCLLGIFNVNMPLLYGEEEKAFRRLQEEIMKSTPDLSILAWTLHPSKQLISFQYQRYFCGVLADSPLSFAKCGSFMKMPNEVTPETSMMNFGLRTKARVLLQKVPGGQRYGYVLALQTYQKSAPAQVLGIRLRMYGHDRYIREDPCNLVRFTGHLDRCPVRDIYLQLTPQLLSARALIAETRLQICQINFTSNVAIAGALAWGHYDHEDSTFILSGDTKQDYSILKLNASNSRLGSPIATVDADFMFYAVGWAWLDVEPSCTLVDYHTYSTSLMNVQSEIAAWDPSSYQVIDLLKYHKIPKSSAAVIKIEGSDQSLFASFAVTLETNRRLSPNKFWRIKIFTQVWDDDQIPQVSHGTWRK